MLPEKFHSVFHSPLVNNPFVLEGKNTAHDLLTTHQLFENKTKFLASILIICDLSFYLFHRDFSMQFNMQIFYF